MNDVRFVDFMQSVRERVKLATAVDKVVAVCVGIAASRVLPVAAQGIEDASSFYDTTLAFSADEMFSAFNEEVIFDIDVAREVCRGMWQIRHVAAVGGSELIIPSNSATFFEQYFGVQQYLSADVLGFMNQNGSAISAMTNRAQALLKV